MVSIEEFEMMAGEIADEIPEIYYDGLNGGILLKDEIKHHPVSRDKAPVYVMGSYKKDAFGCRIELYYGSFAKTCAFFTKERLYRQIKDTLLHEFRHHVETMCGNIDLILEDAEGIRRILKDR